MCVKWDNMTKNWNHMWARIKFVPVWNWAQQGKGLQGSWIDLRTRRERSASHCDQYFARLSLSSCASGPKCFLCKLNKMIILWSPHKAEDFWTNKQAPFAQTQQSTQKVATAVIPYSGADKRVTWHWWSFMGEDIAVRLPRAAETTRTDESPNSFY